MRRWRAGQEIFSRKAQLALEPVPSKAASAVLYLYPGQSSRLSHRTPEDVHTRQQTKLEPPVTLKKSG